MGNNGITTSDASDMTESETPEFLSGRKDLAMEKLELTPRSFLEKLDKEEKGSLSSPY